MQRYVIAMEQQNQPTEVNDALDCPPFYLANPLFCFFHHLFNYEAGKNSGVFFIINFTRQIKAQDRKVLLVKVVFKVVSFPQKSRD